MMHLAPVGPAASQMLLQFVLAKFSALCGERLSRFVPRKRCPAHPGSLAQVCCCSCSTRGADRGPSASLAASRIPPHSISLQVMFPAFAAIPCQRHCVFMTRLRDSEEDIGPIALRLTRPLSHCLMGRPPVSCAVAVFRSLCISAVSSVPSRKHIEQV